MIFFYTVRLSHVHYLFVTGVSVCCRHWRTLELNDFIKKCIQIENITHVTKKIAKSEME